jgi:hypothetical protein
LSCFGLIVQALGAIQCFSEVFLLSKLKKPFLFFITVGQNRLEGLSIPSFFRQEQYLRVWPRAYHTQEGMTRCSILV